LSHKAFRASSGSYLSSLSTELRRTLQTIKLSLEQKNSRSFTGHPEGHYGIRFLLYGPDVQFELGNIKRITLKKVLFQIPPYPAHPKPEPIHEGLIASLDGVGNFLGVTGIHKWNPEHCQYYLEFDSAGYDNTQFRLSYILNNTEGLKPLEGVQEGNKFYYVQRVQGEYRFVVHVKDASTGREEHTYFISVSNFESKQDKSCRTESDAASE
jgi:hypothetical protein